MAGRKEQDSGKLDPNKINTLLKKVSSVKYWDFREQAVTSNNITAWNNDIHNLSTSEKSGQSFRILIGNGWGFAYSYKNNIKNIVEKAVRIAALMDKNAKDKRNVFLGKPVKDSRKSRFKINPADVSLDEKKDLVLSYSKFGEHKSIISKQAFYSDLVKKSFFANSIGTEISQEQIFSTVGIVTTAKDDFIETYFKKSGAQCGYEITSDLDALNKEVNENALALLKAKMPKSSRSDVVVDGGLSEVFVHEALGHASEADHLLEQMSCLKGLDGKKIAPDFVDIYDDATVPGSWGSYFYDEEGVKAQKTPIIKKGVLNSFLHSRESAALWNKKPTGNGRAQDVTFKPVVRMSNTYIEKGDYSFEELLEQLKNGFYLVGSRGGEVDPAIGSFQFSCMQGFAVENGELKGRLRNVAISGKTLEILKNIAAVGNKYCDSWPGQCGKAGQWVFVTGKCPRMFIKNITVGGA